MDNNSENCIERSVVNLSKFKLNEHHISLLKRGLKFCPTPSAPDAGQLREDMDRYHTRLRQIAFFSNLENNNDSTTSFINTTQVAPSNPLASIEPFKNLNFKLKSNWRVPAGPANLEAMIASNEQQYNARAPFIPTFRSNLDHNERKAMK